MYGSRCPVSRCGEAGVYQLLVGRGRVLQDAYTDMGTGVQSCGHQGYDPFLLPGKDVCRLVLAVLDED